MSFREMPNGDLVAIARGKPPASPPGYVQNKKRPLVYHLILEPCKHRRYIEKKATCCNINIKSLHCGVKDKLITPKDCKSCIYLEK